jgi:hypothetical protein
MTFRARVSWAAAGAILVIFGDVGLFTFDHDAFIGGFYSGAAIGGGLCLVLCVAFWPRSRALPEDAIESPSLWVVDLALSERLVTAFNEHRERARAEREATRQAGQVRRWKETVDRLRKEIAELESGEEVARLRRRLGEAETAVSALGAES